MRVILILTAALSAAAVAGSAGAAYRPSPLLPLDGAYRLADGTVVSLAVTPDGGLLYTDTRTGDLRRLETLGKSRFRFGPAYLVQRPARGTIELRGATLRITTGGRTRVGRRVPVKRRQVSFAGQGGRLAGKVTSPVTPGRHPAVAIVHGSEAGDRDYYDLLVNFYSSHGFVVLTYDKRGVGASGGTYLESATPENVENLAGDAIAALRVLSTRQDVDPGRIGLAGGSQAGWIVPRAAARSPLVRFAVVTSGPAVSVGEQELYAALTGQGTNTPTRAQIEQQLEGAEPSGYDPRADLAKLSIPTLWLYGLEDKVVYARQSVAVLRALPTAPDIKVFPHSGHFLLDTPRGLIRELAVAHRFAPGYFSTIADWIEDR
jgi:uncharacterized protein